ncbi:MAG: nucleoid-associated protein [Bacteroidota bacterium]|nr:nucleoid-associated protein [Bacteroidota bacterium]
MISFNDSKLNSISVHHVGNQMNDGSLHLSKAPVPFDEELYDLFLLYFLKNFKITELFHFYHDEAIEKNTAFAAAQDIFENPDNLHDASERLARRLYNKTELESIHDGELHVAYFTECMSMGKYTDAVGIFKSEIKSQFIKVNSVTDTPDITHDSGIGVNKIDKGCLIFNQEKEKGYIVAVIDKVSRGEEAHFWLDDFLQIIQRKDEYYNTQNVMEMCKTFVTKELPNNFEVSKADQADMLNKSVNYFKEKEAFDMNDFSSEVMEQPEVIDSFKNYKQNFQQDRELELQENFDISEPAVQKKSRSLKSVIKLDKNFHIYVHGNRRLIEQGEDESGRKFYKIYYEQEV